MGGLLVVVIMKVKQKTVKKIGDSLYLTLTKELKNIDVDKDDIVQVVSTKQAILIVPADSGVYAFVPIREDIYKTLVRISKERNVSVEDFLEKELEKVCKKYTSIWHKPIIVFK